LVYFPNLLFQGGCFGGSVRFVFWQAYGGQDVFLLSNGFQLRDVAAADVAALIKNYNHFATLVVNK